MIQNSRSLTVCCIAVVCCSTVASAWIAPTTNLQQSITRTQIRTTATVSRQRRGLDSQQHNVRHGDTRLYNKLFDSLSPFDSKIPEELRDEIYKAEANTAAARDRGKRVAIYTSLALLGIALASFNGFLTDMRDKESAIALANTAATSIPDTVNSLYILEQNDFGWVLSNPIFKFLFTNKIGGGLALLFGGGAGLMAEAEFDTKRINAEKIYEELERRRDQKLKKQTGGTGGSTKSSKKKRRSGKEKKRLAAISEVMMDDAADTTTETAKISSPPVGMPKIQAKKIASTDSSTKDETTTSKEAEGDNKPEIFGKMKDLYQQADSMAASQALIMNKNLEEAGVVEKITDETGLKVIGREEAKKLEEKDVKEDTDEKK